MKKVIIFMLTAAFFLTSCTFWNQNPAQSAAGDETSGLAPEDSNPHEDVKSEEMSMPFELSETIDEKEHGNFVYYALGDSIAAGYALENPAEDCYGALFVSRFDTVKYENFAVSGDKTGDLLALLPALDMSDADLVTISIGANNLLSHAIGALGAVFDRFGYGILQEYASALIKGEKSERVEDFIRDIKEALTGSAFDEKAEAGLLALKEDLPFIFEQIQSQNQKENPVFVVQTIYNPYEGFVLGLPGGDIFDLSTECDVYLRRYNEAIAAIAGEYGVLVMDVYGAFQGSKTDFINAGITAIPAISFSFDPHPNARGHVEIADLLYQIWKENRR